MNYYSIPADFKKETIDKYVALNNENKGARVNETYGNITVGNFLGSGRPTHVLTDITIDDLSKYVEYSQKNGIEFSYTLNTSFTHEMEFTKEGMVKIYDFLKAIYDVGVRSITIALPSLIEFVSASDLDFKIKASAVCSITNPNRAMALKSMGAEKIVIDESINKNFPVIKRIRSAFGEKVEVIVNAICYKECVYRSFHYDQMSQASRANYNKVSDNYYRHRCLLQRFDNVRNILKLGWVRPEDIHYYNEIGIRYFKLQGRQAVFKGDPMKTINHYFDQDYDGNLMDLLEMFEHLNNFNIYVDNKKLEGYLDSFFKNDNFCKNDCNSCKYCDKFARKAINYEKAEGVIELANDFYKEFDQFNQLIKETQSENKLITNKNHAEQNIEDSGDFEFGE